MLIVSREAGGMDSACVEMVITCRRVGRREHAFRSPITENFVIWINSVRFDWAYKPNVEMANARVNKIHIILSLKMPALIVHVSQKSPFPVEHFFESQISINTEIDDYCRLTSNCAVKLTTCVKGYCRCPLNHHSNWEKNRCLISAGLNETCSYNDECVAENSVCYRTCKCRTSHVISQDGKRCLPLATTLYQKCHQDSQCAQVSYSYCGSNNTCVCLPNHHDINSVSIADDSVKDERNLNLQLSLIFFQRCHVSVRLEGTCEDDLNCVMAHSSCISRKCRCDDGFHEFRGKFCSKADQVQISFLVLFVLSFVTL